MKQVIEQQLQGVTVDGSPTKGATGAFEVTNVKTKRVYFSKLNGEGYLDGDVEKLKKVIHALKEDGAVPVENPPEIVPGGSGWCSVM